MAEKDLNILLSSISPQLCEGPFVFCSVDEDKYATFQITSIGMFREKEGFTLILERSMADKAALDYSNLWSLITCTINSDLTAVGSLAAMSSRLAEAGIAVNAVSAYYHDHLFVPTERAAEALELPFRFDA